MVLRPKLKRELKKISDSLPEKIAQGSDLLGNFSKQLTQYEKKAMNLVKDIESKGREARTMGQKKLDKLMNQLQTTRTTVEKRVGSLVEIEKKRINSGVNDLLNYLKSTAKNEKITPKKMASPKKKATKAVSGGKSKTKKRTAKMRPMARRASNGRSSHASAH